MEEKDMPKTILLVGTLDTKGAEYGYARDLIVARGHGTLIINAGISGDPTIEPDI
jgi:uncharacterized protein (UPF0261 family)